MTAHHLFSDRLMHIIGYCAEEVRRQGDTPVHVAYMVAAWEHAWTQSVLRGRLISSELIQEIGGLVEPSHNISGFRQYGVRVGSSIKLDWEAVPRAIDMLCEAWNEGRIDSLAHPLAGMVEPADHFYFIFEDVIHPFGDGNGRTGKIVRALISGTLDNPTWPPNFWNSGNP